MKTHLTHQFWTIFLVVAFYWIVSITTVFLNKILLSSQDVQLDAPIFITWFQCVVTALYYLLYKILTKQNVKQSPLDVRIVKAIFPVSLTFALMIVFNNLCLKLVDVSFYYIGRSLTTVFNVVLTYLVLGERTSWKICYCCVVIVIGFWLGVDQEQFVGSFSIKGTVYGVLASLCVAVYAIQVKKVLPCVDSTTWILSYYINIYSCIIFVPLILLFDESTVLLNYQHIASARIWGLLVLSGLCGLTIGYASNLQIKVTSPLTHNISGTAKACAQTVLASYFYAETRSWLWWLSNWIVLVGSLIYTRVKQVEMESKNAQQYTKV